jgi:hypothetical protein
LGFRGFLEQLESEGELTRIRKVSTELDSSGDLTEGKKARTCKMGLDATILSEEQVKDLKRKNVEKLT